MSGGYDKAEVFRRIPMPTMLDTYSIEHHGVGKNISCPFHAEANPSCTVHEDHLYCHSNCGRKDIFDLWQLHNGGGFREAIRALAEEAGVRSEGDIGAQDAFERFCRERHLKPALLLGPWRGRVGTRKSPKTGRRRPALTVATDTGIDRVRFLDPCQGDEPKVSWSAKGGRAHWYGLVAAKTILRRREKAGGKPGTIYIVNGEPSVWACYQSNVAAVCTAAGEGMLPRDADLLRGIASDVCIAYDNDEAGRKGARSVRDRLKRQNVCDPRILDLSGVVADKGDVDDLHRVTGDDGLADALGTLPDLPELTQAQRADEAQGSADGGGAAAVPSDGRVVLELRGDLHDRVRAIGEWIARNNSPPWLFRRGRSLVIVQESVGVEGARSVIGDVGVDRLAGLITERVQLVLVDDTTGHRRVVDPPADILRTYLSAIRWEDIPPLFAILRNPCFAPSGDMLTEDGYYPEMGAYLDTGGVIVPDVSNTPTTTEVAEAKRRIFDEFLGDFRFEDDDGASLSHALAFLLLPFVRTVLSRSAVTPLHLVTAPMPRSGKTLLVNALATVATGVVAVLVNAPKESDEWGKRLSTALLSSPAAILIDNLTEHKELNSADFASVLTSNPAQFRLLGTQELIQCPNNAAWALTANNPRLSNEITERSILIRVDPKVPRPQDRTDIRNTKLLAWTRDHRESLLWACMTLVQSWVAQGMPRVSEHLGGFEEWTEVMGGLLGAIGVKGFRENRLKLSESSNSEMERWTEFVRAWWSRHKGECVTVRTLVSVAEGVDEMAEMFARCKTDQGKIQKLVAAMRSRMDTTLAAAGGVFRIVRSRDPKANCHVYALVPQVIEGGRERSDPDGGVSGTQRGLEFVPAIVPATQPNEIENETGTAGTAGTLSPLARPGACAGARPRIIGAGADAGVQMQACQGARGGYTSQPSQPSQIDYESIEEKEAGTRLGRNMGPRNVPDEGDRGGEGRGEEREGEKREERSAGRTQATGAAAPRAVVWEDPDGDLELDGDLWGSDGGGAA